MAADHYELGNVSMVDLLKSSGYLQEPSTVQEEALEAGLRAHPELIETWVRYSVDKRTSSGWYLRAPFDLRDSAGWFVGHLPDQPERSFPDGFKACSFFIKQEIEAIQGKKRSD